MTTKPISIKRTTLCIKHRLPGLVVRGGDNHYVITAWAAAKHGNEEGIIILNDGIEVIASHRRKPKGFNSRRTSAEAIPTKAEN